MAPVPRPGDAKRSRAPALLNPWSATPRIGSELLHGAFAYLVSTCTACCCRSYQVPTTLPDRAHWTVAVGQNLVGIITAGSRQSFACQRHAVAPQYRTGAERVTVVRAARLLHCRAPTVPATALS